MTRRAGVVTGFVKEVDAEQGRVMVEYRGIEDDMLSPWAYIAAPMSGGGRGALFMPEENDEVLVCYADGHFDHPYIVGFLWNGEQTSPETEAHNRVIITPGGHQLRFEDEENNTRIILRSNGGHSVTLEDHAGDEQIQIKTNNNREVRLEDKATGKVVIKSGQHEITMDDAPSSSKIQIAAGSSAVTITLNVTPQPSISVSVAGNTVDLSATGATLTTPGVLSINATGVANISCSTANITAGTTNLTSSVFNVNAGITNFSGVVTARAFLGQAVVSPAYTPGLFNLI